MGKNTKKIIQALAFIAANMPDRTIDAMKAYKLLWLADRCHLRQSGRTITGDKYYALPKGVVPTDAKRLLDGVETLLENPSDYFNRWIEKVGEHQYKVVHDPDLSEFSDSDIEVLKKVVEFYGGYARHDLSALSHKYPEWKMYEDMLLDKKSKNSFPINVNLMFENPEEDDSPLFQQSNEMLEVTKEIYNEFHS